MIDMSRYVSKKLLLAVESDMNEKTIKPNFPQSRYDHDKLNHAWENGVAWGPSGRLEGAKRENVHPSKFRATQDFIYRSHLKKLSSDDDVRQHADRYEHPKGVRTKNGDVHLIDGHHRAYNAMREGKHLSVDLVDAKF